MSLMCPISSLYLESSVKATFHSLIKYRMRSITGLAMNCWGGTKSKWFHWFSGADWTGLGAYRAGGRSGNRRTRLFKNSLDAIWRWKGYPQFLTQLSNNYSRWWAQYDAGGMTRKRKNLRWEPAWLDLLWCYWQVAQLPGQRFLGYQHTDSSSTITHKHTHGKTLTHCLVSCWWFRKLPYWQRD